MIIIYNKDEKEFKSLGLGTLLPTSCRVKEKENGMYSLELKHSRDKTGKWNRLQEGRIILAPTPDGMQPFRIFAVDPNMKEISVKANHIFYDLLDNYVLFCNSGSRSANDSLQELQKNFEYATPFTFSSDITTEGRVYIGEQNPVFCLLGESDNDEEKTFFQAFGGEIKRNRFHVSMNVARGKDRGLIIAYKKNLIGLNVSENHSEVATRVYPVDSDGNRMSGLYVDSPRIKTYAHPKIRKLPVDNVKYNGDQTRPPTDEEMRKAAEEFFKNGGDLPVVNIKVDFVELSKTEEYKNFKNLQSVFLGDVVTVVNPEMKFQKKAKVISYEYDSILQKYDKIELGDFIPNIYKPISSGAVSVGVANSAKTQSSSLATILQAHLQDFNNPHKVTAGQVGAEGGSGGAVDLTEINKRISELEDRLQAHLQDFNNPHKVTFKTQSKSVIPKEISQDVTPDTGFDALSSVNVKGVPYTETPNSAGGITVKIGEKE